MRSIDAQSISDMYASNINIISGIRPAGRTVDNTATGRSFHGLLYIWSGEAHFYAQDKATVTATEGELLLLPKGYRYKMQYTAPSTTFVLVDFDLHTTDGKEATFFDEITFLAKDDPSRQIARIMTSFELCGVSKDLSASLRKKELFYRLLGHICKQESPISFRYHGTSRIFAGTCLLEQSYLENVPVSALAKACNVSINTFRTLFKQQYGMSPIQYRNRLRIDRAATLLAEGSCTVSEAGYACGFENIGYFCRYYKKITGESPVETKKRNG